MRLQVRERNESPSSAADVPAVIAFIPRFGARSQVDEVADIDRISPHRVQLAVLLSDGIMWLRVGLTLGHGRSSMHGVVPQCAVE
jgi:hypothetical protein